MRKTIFLALLISAVTAFAAQKPDFFRLGNNPSKPLMVSALSDNGIYAVAQNQAPDDVDNPKSAGGILVNIDTRETIAIGAQNLWTQLYDVADNGMVVGELGGRPGCWHPDTQNWTTFNVPSQWGGGSFTAVTPDGHYAVGYYYGKDNEFERHPMCYNLETGKEIGLTNLPKVDLSGLDQHLNAFYGISPDGRYALGQMSESYLMPVALFSYVYDLEKHTWTPIGYNYNPQTSTFVKRDNNLHFVSNQTISCDGSMVCGEAYAVVGKSEIEGGSEFFCGYAYNIASDTFSLLCDENDKGIAVNQTTPDGTLLCSITQNPYPAAYVRRGKFNIPLDLILEQVYGTSLYKELGTTCNGMFKALSADGRIAVMLSYDDCYIMRMHESFADAASKVNLLADYTAYPEPTTAMTKFSEVKITFSSAISSINNPSSIKLTNDVTGAAWSASGCAVASTNNHQLVVTFRTRTLEAGQSYTLSIPAGYVALRDDPSIKSQEIKISYTGRADQPVRPISVAPRDGASVAQLNPQTDYITVTFDSQVRVSDDALCQLFCDDDPTPVTSLLAAAVGNNVLFYPAATQLLYDGSTYRVVIASGAVTDISGCGASQEIVLNYKGSYKRQISDSDLYIFNDHCNSYENFLFWQFDFNEPGQVAQNWGFTAENPWLLTRDDDNSTNWAMTAHSMFAKSGTADDWLVTPQLYIPDANTYLAFDAQSYLKSKADRLKVIVRELNAVYNYLTKDRVEDIRDCGVVVFDEQLTPGASEEKLDGDWTHYTIDLAPFAGKNIYIAFVNNNTDQSAIFIDNVQVARNLDFIVNNQTPERVVGRESVNVKGEVIITSELKCYDFISVRLLSGNEEIAAISGSETLTKGDTYPFAFSLPLTPGVETPYIIDVKLSDTDNTSFAYTIKNLMFEPTHKVVLEEYSGSRCGNCPLGLRAVEYLEQRFPNNFIPVILRTFESDQLGYGVMDYSNFLGFTGAPSGRINRGRILPPMAQTANGYIYNGRGLTDSDGNELYLWADAVEDALASPAEASVEFHVDYDADTRALSIPITLTYALNTTNRPVRLFAVVVEDNLPSVQLNYFSSISDPNLGDWAQGGRYGSSPVSFVISDVARFTPTKAFNGELIETTDFQAGTPYTHTISAVVPEDRLDNPQACKVVVMMIDGSTDHIVNANVARFGSSGIDNVAEDFDNLNLTIDTDVITATGNGVLTLRIYDVAGALLGTTYGTDHASIALNGFKGIAVAHVATGNAAVVKKILVK